MALKSLHRPTVLFQLTYLYFLQGIPYGFQVKYLPVILRKHGHKLDVISFLNLVSLPWILKFSWAHLFDRYGRNGRVWIFWCLTLLSMFSALLYSSTQALWLMTPCLLTLSFLSASLDIAVDSLAIKLFDSKELGYCNIGHIVGYKIGILLGGGALLALHQEIGLQLFTRWLSIMFGFSAFVIIGFDLSIFHKDNYKNEKPKTTADNSEEATSINKGILSQHLLSPDQIWLIVYVFLYKTGEQGFASMYQLFLIDKGLSLSHIGIITGVFGQVCSMTGSTIGGILISKFGLNMKELLFRTASLRFILIVIYSTFLTKSSIPVLPHVIIDCIFQLLAGAMTTLTFTAMMQSSKLLPDDIHASHFTVISAFEILGKLSIKSLSGTITSTVGFLNFFLICCCLDGFVVLLLFIRCKSNYAQTKSDSKTKVV